MTEAQVPKPYSYALATGEKAAQRLALVQDVYGTDAERLLSSIGVHSGQQVVDFGCGTGSTIPWLARKVGPDGTVLGLDASADQLAIAQQFCTDAGIVNAKFHLADVYETGLPRNTFDLAHCRLLLCHLQHPQTAIQEMADTVKPGGKVVCFDIDLEQLFSIPNTEAYAQLRDLYLERRKLDGLDNTLTSKVPYYLCAAGLVDVEMSFIHPVYFRGEQKRLWELTFAESAARTLEKGLIDSARLEQLMKAVAAVALDEQIAVAQARMPVFWATKPN
jgi:ubiquinone/menaquinone biosynthesis C-methylase UbiE